MRHIRRAVIALVFLWMVFCIVLWIRQRSGGEMIAWVGSSKALALGSSSGRINIMGWNYREKRKPLGWVHTELDRIELRDDSFLLRVGFHAGFERTRGDDNEIRKTHAWVTVPMWFAVATCICLILLMGSRARHALRAFRVRRRERAT